jgi:hypothetical protein
VIAIEGSCSWPIGTAFPEILKTAAEAATPERNNGVGASGGPVHAGALEACSHNQLAAGFHYAGGRAQALRFKCWIRHPLSVAMNILQAHSGCIALVRMAANGAQQIRDTAGVEFVMPSLRPISRLL